MDKDGKRALDGREDVWPSRPARWRQTAVRCAWITAIAAGLSSAAVPLAGAQGGPDKIKDKITIEVFGDGIRLVHQTSRFFAPYQVRPGETFAVLSQRYYGTPDYAGVLAEANGVSPLEPPAAGSFVYIIAATVDLRFSKANAAAQLAVVQRFLASVPPKTALTYAWDDADISVDVEETGEWRLTKYDTARLRIFPAGGTKKPELELRYRKSPLLQIITGDKTIIDVASITWK